MTGRKQKGNSEIGSQGGGGGEGSQLPAEGEKMQKEIDFIQCKIVVASSNTVIIDILKKVVFSIDFCLHVTGNTQEKIRVADPH